MNMSGLGRRGACEDLQGFGTTGPQQCTVSPRNKFASPHLPSRTRGGWGRPCPPQGYRRCRLLPPVARKTLALTSPTRHLSQMSSACTTSRCVNAMCTDRRLRFAVQLTCRNLRGAICHTWPAPHAQVLTAPGYPNSQACLATGRSSGVRRRGRMIGRGVPLLILVRVRELLHDSLLCVRDWDTAQSDGTRARPERCGAVLQARRQRDETPENTSIAVQPAPSSARQVACLMQVTASAASVQPCKPACSDAHVHAAVRHRADAAGVATRAPSHMGSSNAGATRHATGRRC